MRIKLICFDFDDTLTKENSWYSLNTAMGIFPEEDYAMYVEYKHGHVTYTEWTHKIETLYRNRGLATKDRITKVLQRFELRHDAKGVISKLQEKGYEVVIISGSFDITIKKAAEILTIKTWRAGTKINFDSKNNFLNFTSHDGEAETKLLQLKEICSEKGIAITDCVCIGDGANDLKLFKATGHGICFIDGTDEVRTAAEHYIQNLSDLLHIL
jgi:phosphoserine phosphatase